MNLHLTSAEARDVAGATAATDGPAPLPEGQMRRVGVLDVGSNSVRLVVFDGAARSPAYFYNEKILCGLGRSLAKTGTLDVEGRKRAHAAIKRFALLADRLNISPLTCVATAAVREASDGLEFCDEIFRRTGLELEVASGEREARLSAQGVLLGWPGAEGLVCDMGGSSMELAEITDGEIRNCTTSALGPLSLRRVKGGRRKQAKYIGRTLRDLRARFGKRFSRIYVVGGSWRVLARLDMARRNYPLSVLHEYRMTKKSVVRTVKWMRDFETTELKSRFGVSTGRMKLVPSAALVLKSLVRNFDPDEIAVSSYGIREGLLYDSLPDWLKRRDPLIEACRYSERSAARLPGFGDVLFAFVTPLFDSADNGKLRLVRAACLLHDVTWRAHPDYRADVSFDNATRVNLGGLDHPGRVFLALALFHRYKENRSGTRIDALANWFLTPEEIAEATTLGRAMRFGSMFTAMSSDEIGTLTRRDKTNELEFRPPAKLRDLYGEVAATRFRALAKSLQCRPIVSEL